MRIPRFIPIALLIGLILSSSQALAEVPLQITIYKADPSSSTGYKETYQWRLNENDEWRRFVYLVGKMETARKEDVSPFLRKPDEMIVLSYKDDNGITGKDYYLSPYGLMVTSILAKNTYFVDSHGAFDFLKDQLSHQSSFEKYPGEKISPDTKGIVIRYRINENLPNPAWLVTKDQDVYMYDTFFKKLSPANAGDIAQFMNFQTFEEKGNFSLILNYAHSPARFATIGERGIRLSQLYSTDLFYADPKNYYEYFYNLTQESSRLRKKVDAKEKKIIEQGQF